MCRPGTVSTSKALPASVECQKAPYWSWVLRPSPPVTHTSAGETKRAFTTEQVASPE